jgi:MinD-like ATPase involved in chromosome partitioning or flagellar assembly
VCEHESTGLPEAQKPEARLGPLLAVCGLAGGAGATTLAYLVALAAARETSEPVLVADLGGPSGGLATCAGVQTLSSLPELASDLADGLPIRAGLYATGPAGLRVIATGPSLSSTGAYEQLRGLLMDAREAHRLTVIDCGTLGRDVDQVAIEIATHVVWILPATAAGVAHGAHVLDCMPHTPPKEIIIARGDSRHPKAGLRELRRIAAGRPAPLVLMPHLADLKPGGLESAVEAAQVPLQAILGALQR